MPSTCSNNFKLVRFNTVYTFTTIIIIISYVWSGVDYKEYATHIVVVQTSLSRFWNQLSFRVESMLVILVA